MILFEPFEALLDLNRRFSHLGNVAELVRGDRKLIRVVCL